LLDITSKYDEKNRQMFKTWKKTKDFEKTLVTKDFPEPPKPRPKRKKPTEEEIRAHLEKMTLEYTMPTKEEKIRLYKLVYDKVKE
jgi:uracil-DNA glycosylase